MANKIERRKQQRIKVRWPITVFTDHDTIEGETRNISVDGIFICCEKPLRLKEIFRMYITPPDHKAIGVSGKVLWSDLYGIDDESTAVAMGICFVKISDGDRRFFKGMASVHPEYQ